MVASALAKVRTTIYVSLGFALIIGVALFGSLVFPLIRAGADARTIVQAFVSPLRHYDILLQPKSSTAPPPEAVVQVVRANVTAGDVRLYEEEGSHWLRYTTTDSDATLGPVRALLEGAGYDAGTIRLDRGWCPQVNAAGDSAAAILTVGALGAAVFGVPVALLLTALLLPDGGLKPRLSWPRSVLWAVATAVACQLFAWVATSLLQVFGLELREHPLLDAVRGHPSGLWLVVLGAVVVAPLSEEIMFRRYLFQVMCVRVGLWPALLLSGLAFGLLHHDVAWTPVYSGIGVMLAVAYLRTGRLMTVVLAHALVNAISISALVWGM